MNNSISIHQLNRSDWRQYRDIRLCALKDSPDAFGNTFEVAKEYSDAQWQARLDNVRADTDHPIVAVHNQTFVGLAWGNIEPSNKNTAYLYQMWVSPQHRGMSIGRKMLQAVIDWAKALGVSVISLEVTCGNLPAIQLYNSMGFERVGEFVALREGSDLLEQSMRLNINS